MVIYCENDISMEKYVVKSIREDRAIISSENINRLKAIQEIIFLEEGKALTFDEVISVALGFFERSIQINS